MSGHDPHERLPLRREVPIVGEYDLVVCGGGPSGCAAALAGAREGLNVLLLEAQAQFGGTATSGLVSHWLGGRTQEGEWVVGGIFRDMVLEAVAEGAAVLPTAPRSSTAYHPHGWLPWFAHGVPLDPVKIAFLLDRRVSIAGVDARLCSTVVDVAVEEDEITGIVFHDTGGFQGARTRLVVDSTGDGDIAALSGCILRKGRADDGGLAPATLGMHVECIDHERLAKHINAHGTPKFRSLIRRLRSDGEWQFPYDIFVSVQLVDRDTALINTSRLVGIDGIDGRSYTEGLMRGRNESFELLTILKRHLPGFEKARIRTAATMLGVRETRRIVGDFELTVDDLVQDARFEDTIGFSIYGWDLPDPKKPSVQPLVDESTGTYESRIEKSLKTPIPYRVMLPRPITNLICTGRMVSVERDVLGPIRVMAPCMAMGEAAGTAAAMASNGRFAGIDTSTLRRRLQDRGAIVEESQLPEITPRVDPPPRE